MTQDLQAIRHSSGSSSGLPLEHSDSPRAIWVLFSLIACFLWIFVVRLHSSDEPFERDILCMVLMARELNLGAKFYVDVVEFKPTGAYMIWQAVDRLIGSEPYQILIVNIATATVSMLGVYVAASTRPWGRGAGLWAAAFWAVISGESNLQGNQPNIEVFINAFMVWSFALLLRAKAGRTRWWMYVIIGLLFAGGTLQKHHLFFPVLALGAAWIFAARRLKEDARAAWQGFAIVAVTVAGSWIALIGYFTATGRFWQMFDQLFKYALFYASTQGGEGSNRSGGILSNIIQGLTPVHMIPHLLAFVLPLGVCMAFLVSRESLQKRFRPILFIFAWLASTFFVVAIPGTFFPHYYQLYLPVLAIGGAWGVKTFTSFTYSSKESFIPGAITLVFVLYYVIPDFSLTGEQLAYKKYRSTGIIAVRDAGEVLNKMLRRDENFYLLGIDPGTYFWAHRRPPTGIMWASRILYGPLAEKWTDKTISDLERREPDVVIMQKDFRLDRTHRMAQWIVDRYLLIPGIKIDPEFPTFMVHKGSDLQKRIESGETR